MIAPKSPLPWKLYINEDNAVADADGDHIGDLHDERDRAYAVHAANALPEVVAALETTGKALDEIFSVISYVNIHGVGVQPEPREDGAPQPMKVDPDEFWRLFQKIGRLAADALKVAEPVAARAALAKADAS